ncbi:MAG: hypothetical protein ACYC2H_06855 [Thermoplasmatota archaeon]
MTGSDPAGLGAPASRIALYSCPCCGGSSSLPLAAGQRPPARRACPNGGCWACLGVCRSAAARTEVLKADKPARRRQAPAMQDRAATRLGAAA